MVRFPDAPTLRGVKHLDELAKAREAGYEAAVCFVIQMENVRWFAPNDETHPEFGQAPAPGGPGRGGDPGHGLRRHAPVADYGKSCTGKIIKIRWNSQRCSTFFYPRKRGERGNLYRHSCSWQWAHWSSLLEPNQNRSG